MNSPIHQFLADKATDIVSKQQKRKADIPSFQPFRTGGLGNFPYYWQDPNSLKFNNKTYQWINANLKANTFPIEQAIGSTFTNLFINALGSISYSISAKDQEKLKQAGINIITQQNSIIKVWKTVYSKDASIDTIIYTICNTWASPPTTLTALQNSPNISTVLNNTPPSGKSIIPFLDSYISAINSYNSLNNASSRNTGYLQTALQALQSPNLSNGGIPINNNKVYPAYHISPSVQDILEELSSSDKISVQLSIKPIDTNNAEIHIPGLPAHSMPIDQLISIKVDKDASLFKNALLNATEPTLIEITFSGIAFVYFEPVTFNQTSEQNWYWIPPIIEAIKNGDSNVTGFKFSPKPSIDFSKKGSFGFLSAVAISNSPDITITLTGNNHQKISDTINKASLLELELLGTSLESENSTPRLTKVIKPTNNSQTLIIQHTIDTLTKSPSHISTQSTAWVLGVQTEYPAS